MGKKSAGASLDLCSVPGEVGEALTRSGGLDGLTRSLPGDEVLEAQIRIFQACADPIRLRILAMLSRDPLCVCVMKAVLGIADSKLSYHLAILKKAGLVEGEQQGNWIIYRITDEGRKFAP
jgi:ArsR family transcriptional regulator